MDEFLAGLLGAIVGAIGGGVTVGLVPLVMGVVVLVSHTQVHQRLVIIERRLWRMEGAQTGAATRSDESVSQSVAPKQAVEASSGAPSEERPSAPDSQRVSAALSAATDNEEGAAEEASVSEAMGASRCAAGSSPTPQMANPFAGWSLPSPEKVVVWLAASIGAFMLLIGTLFALVAVARTGWFGPSTRVCVALLAGTATWVLGAGLRGRVGVLPSALEGLGMGMLFATLFAARSYYELLGPTVAMVLLVGVAAVATLRATVHDDRFMAHLGLLGGFLAPVLVSTGENNPVGLFSYLFLLLLGNLGAAAFRRWFDVIAFAALGTAALYLGWTASWYEPESASVALVAAVGLGLPFAVLLARTPAESDATAVGMTLSAALGAAVFPLVAVPWVLPVDPVFVDPRTGLEVVSSPGALFAWTTAAVAVLALPTLVAARLRRSVVLTIVGATVGLPALLTWYTGWMWQHSDALLGLSVGLLAPLVLALLVFLGERRAGAGLVPLVPSVGFLLALSTIPHPDGGVFGASLLLFVVVIAAGAFTSSRSILAAAGLWTLAIALGLLASVLDQLGVTWVAGASLSAMALLGVPALVAKLEGDALHWVARVSAVLAPVLFFPTLYACWDQGWGDAVIGLLPVLLGLWGLLAATVLARVHKLGPTHPVVAIAVAVALGGVTFALPIQLQDKALTVGWALEAVALAWLAGRLRQPLPRWTAVLLGLAVGVRLLLNPWALAYGDASGWPIFNWTLYTWGVPTLCLLAVASLTVASRPSRGPDLLLPAPTALRVIAMFTGFALVNVEVSHFFQDSGPIALGGTTTLQGMVRSLAWGGWGMTLLGVGLAVNSRYTRFIGFSFMLLAAVKVLIYDIYSLPGFVRVGSLLGLGVILLTAAFVFERLVIRDLKASTSQRKEDDAPASV